MGHPSTESDAVHQTPTLIAHGCRCRWVLAGDTVSRGKRETGKIRLVVQLCHSVLLPFISSTPMSFDADDPNFPAKRLKLSNKDDISQENARENPDPFATPTKSSFDLTRNEPSTELPLISATLPPSALLEANGNRNAPSFTLCATLMGHSKGLSTVKISPDAKYVVTAGAS